MRKEKIMWVVEWCGTRALPGDDPVIFLHPKMKVETVGEILELLYMAETGDKEEKIMYAHAKGKRLPHAFRYRVSEKNVVSCGHNPQLVARRIAYPMPIS